MLQTAQLAVERKFQSILADSFARLSLNSLLSFLKMNFQFSLSFL